MPELYGNPFKHELRAEISELNRQLSQERKERRLAQDRLVYARAQVRELNGRLQQITALTALPIAIDAVEELRKDRKRRWDEIEKAVEAAA